MLPAFILICGFAATALATYFINENNRSKARQRIEEATHLVERTLQVRMEAYIGLLRGGAGLFAANPTVSLDQFRKFHERLEIERRYPGLQGFGYTVQFPAEKRNALVANMRRQGLTEFDIWPGGNRDPYSAIVFLEPPDLRNRRALGYDMLTDPARRIAMETARDSGNPCFTTKLRLVQEFQHEPGQPGFLVYLPIYLGGVVPATIEERRAKLQGFIYSPFRAGDLFQGMFPRGVPGLAFSIWDGTNPKADALLYQSHSDFQFPKAKTLSRLQIPGTIWTLAAAPLPGANRQGGEVILWLVPVLGVIASLLLSYFAHTEGRARTRFERTANELFNQREWLQVTLASIGDAVMSTDTEGRVQFMNGVAEKLTGWTLAEAEGKELREVFEIHNELTGESAENPASRVLSTGEVVNLADSTVLIDRSGVERCIDDSAAPIRDRDGNVVGVVLVFREITERRRYERRSAAQHAITGILADSPSLEDASSQILSSVCSHLHFRVGILWLFDHGAGVARVARVWHEPDPQLEAFSRRCIEFRPRVGEGIPGTVWKTGSPIWVSDFGDEKQFSQPRSTQAEEADLRTAFAFPIQIESEPFGALEFFSRERMDPDEELLNAAEAIGIQIGQFIQRKNAESSLARSEELYRAISETAADGIVVINEESTILTVNRALEGIFGYSSNELVGKSLKQLMPERMREAYERSMKQFTETTRRNISWNGVELPGLHKNGSEIPLEISFGMAKHGEGYLFTGLIRDVSRRKEAERQLRETEERFGLLVRLAEDYAIITMAPDGAISTWNPGAQRIFGYTDSEVIGKGQGIFFTEEDRAEDVPARQLSRAEAEGHVLDERWQVRKNGSRFWASGSTVCLRTEEGTVRGFAKILRDITERKKVEEGIRELNQELEIRVQRRTAALQESKEQMEAFSYTVAHDLRAPLRAMQGFAHAMLDDYGKRLDPAGVEFLERIMASAHRMDELIQDLLAYSQLSRSDLSFKPASVKEVVENTLIAYERIIKEAHAEVKLSLDGLFVRAHPATLENALGNLISNAIKFTPPGQTPKLHIRAINQGNTVQISVQDNGIGIAPEHHERIFRVFERLHSQEAYPGTGIGLALVRKGVERMGGKVGVVSDPGKGSLFWIELPREELQFEV